MPDTPTALTVRKLAGADDLAREVRFHPQTGEKYFANPITGEARPLPLAGVTFADPSTGEPIDAPALIVVPHHYADREDWIELVNPQPIHKPGGPADNPWRQSHTFLHVDELVFHMVDGDYRYRVVHQPDKYDDETGEPTDNAGDPTTHVDWFYLAKLLDD